MGSSLRFLFRRVVNIVSLFINIIDTNRWFYFKNAVQAAWSRHGWASATIWREEFLSLPSRPLLNNNNNNSPSRFIIFII